jgi:hypothetical protein
VPVSPKRHAELEVMLKGCPAGQVYDMAFTEFTAFKKYATEYPLGVGSLDRQLS